MQWTNDLRAQNNLPLYTLDTRLTATANERTHLAQERGYINHKRAKKDAYYDYKKITKWFRDRGLSFQKIHGGTFSESIGY